MNTPLQIFIMGEDATSLFWWPCEHVPSVGEIITTEEAHDGAGGPTVRRVYRVVRRDWLRREGVQTEHRPAMVAMHCYVWVEEQP